MKLTPEQYDEMAASLRRQGVLTEALVQFLIAIVQRIEALEEKP